MYLLDHPGSDDRPNRQAALDWLHGLQKLGIKLGLENTRNLCRLLGHPERSFEPVLVAGTNGKGSVAAMLEAILGAAGITRGLFTSPHLVHPEERIRIGGRDVASDVFVEILSHARRTIDRSKGSGDLPRHPTFFEVMTAVGFEAFDRAGIECGVLEVGLGGRFDSTNVSEPVLSVVSSVDLDHRDQLGDDLAAVAREKAGVFRPGRPALIGETKLDALVALSSVARKTGSRCILVSEEADVRVVDDGLDPAGAGRLRLDLTTPVRTYRELAVPLPGAHQASNVAVAVRAAELLAEGALSRGEFALSEEAVRDGLAATRWRGRLEWVPGHPPLLLDAAHNPAAAAKLAAALRRIGPDRCVLLLGAMRDKDIEGMIRALIGCARRIITTSVGQARAAGDRELLETLTSVWPQASVSAGGPVAPALGAARAAARDAPRGGENGIVCVAGSIFLVGEVLSLIEDDNGPGAP